MSEPVSTEYRERFIANLATEISRSHADNPPPLTEDDLAWRIQYAREIAVMVFGEQE